MYRATTVPSVCCLVVIFVSLIVNLQAQTHSPTFRSPADAGRTNRYRANLIRYNESWAVRIVRTLASSQATYQATSGNGNFATLAELSREGLIDHVTAQGHRNGYLFRVRVEKFSSESPSSFEIVAVPRKYGRTGRRSFYLNETGAIVAADRKGAEANAKDDPLDP